MEGAQAEDTDADYIINILENQTVIGDSILSCLTNLIMEICNNPQTYNNEVLQKSAIIALGRCLKFTSFKNLF